MSFRTSLVAIVFVLLSGPAFAQPRTEVWEGELKREEVGTALRLTLTRDGDAVQAALDLPDLVYAEEPVGVAPQADGALAVTLPFGLGQFALREANNRLSGSQGRLTISLSRAPPTPYTHETITIPIEGGTYRGELYTPTDLRHPHGAIVVAGGAAAVGDHLNWSTRSWCDFYARQGLHCLVYPRREKAADDDIAPMVQDVADLRAAVALMAARPNVDRTRVGVFGSSRGTWLAARAAAQDPAIRFLILNAPPATTPSEQEISSVVYRMRDAGNSDAEIADAVAYLRLYFSVAHTRQGWDAMADAAARVQTERWSDLVSKPTHMGDLDWYHVNGEFDPTRDYAALTIPVFAYWGGRDPVVPPSCHRGLLQALARPNAQFETHIFPLGDHRGEREGGFDAQHNFHWFGMAPGVLDGIKTWLAAHGYSDAPHRRR